MKKPAVIVFIAISFTAAAPAFERDMLNLKTPSTLDAGNAVIDIQHRFYGTVGDDPVGTVLGMTGGANVHLGFRYYPWRPFEIKPSITLFQKEYTVAAGYSSRIAKIARTKINVEFYSYRLPEMEDRRQNFFYSLAVEGEPTFNVMSPALVVGYDGYEERFGAGLGLAAGIDREGPVKHVAIIGEYYPSFDRDDERTGPEDCFAAGFELQTYGHHFAFLVGNSSQIGTRRLMLGAEANDLYFGFNIYRLIEF
jgi:hypothetical protein